MVGLPCALAASARVLAWTTGVPLVTVRAAGDGCQAVPALLQRASALASWACRLWRQQPPSTVRRVVVGCVSHRSLRCAHILMPHRATQTLPGRALANSTSHSQRFTTCCGPVSLSAQLSSAPRTGRAHWRTSGVLGGTHVSSDRLLLHRYYTRMAVAHRAGARVGGAAPRHRLYSARTLA